MNSFCGIFFTIINKKIIMCKYYSEKTREIPMGPFGINKTIIRKCIKTILDKNGKLFKITECMHFNDFNKCEYFEKKEINL
jgi:hypothetical protein